MGFFDRAKSDNKRILGGEDMRSVTLYNAAGASQDGFARVVDTEFEITPQGKAINTRKLSIAFHIDDFSTITGANENYKNWQGEFLNSKGETKRGVFQNQFVDRTFGSVVTNLSFIKG